MHQIPDGAQGLLTTIPGGIVADTRNTLRSEEQGLSLLEGFTSRVHITHLNHQRISELIVHVARASIGQAPIVAAKQRRSWAGKAACRKGRYDRG
jgi:catalase